MQLLETASIVARLRADTSSFTRGMRDAQREMSSLGAASIKLKGVFTQLNNVADGVGKIVDAMNQKLQNAGRSLSDIGRKAQLGALGVAGVITGLVKQAGDFEQAMARVSAVANASAEEQAALAKAARDTGRSTVFSATQSAEALENLASAGFNVQDSIKALSGTLTLAAATQADLADATELVASQIMTFKLNASEASRVSNVLASGMNYSMATFEKLQFSLRYTAPLFASLNMSIEDNVAALGLLYNAGFRGEQAGTTLRGAISRLLNPTKQMAAVVKKYGLTLDDVNPATHSFSEILHNLAPVAQNTNDAMKLFGTEAGPGMLAILNAGAPAFDKLKKQITGTNDATRMASQMNNTLYGRLKLLKNALQDGAISIGNGFIPAIERLTDIIGGLVAKFDALPEATKQLVAKWIAAIGVGLALASGLSVVGFMLRGMGIALKALSMPLQIAIRGFTLLGRVLLGTLARATLPIVLGIGAIALGVYLLYEAWKTNFGGIRDLIVSVWNAIKPHLQALLNDVKDLINAVRVGDWRRAWTDVKKIAVDAWNIIASAIATVWDTVILPKLAKIDALMGHPFTTTWKWLVTGFDWFMHNIMPYLKAAFNSTWTFLVNTAGTVWAWLRDVAWPVVTKGAATAWNFTLNALGAAWDWIQHSAWPVISAGAKTAWAFTLNAVGEMWEWVQDAWPVILDGIDSAWNFTVNAIGELWGWLRNTAWPVITKGIGSAWNFTLNSLGAAWEWIKKEWPTLKAGIKSAWGFTVNALGAAWTWLREHWPTIKTGIQSAWGFTLNLLGDAWEWMRKTAWSVIANGVKKAWDFTLNLLGDSWTWLKTEWPNIKTGIKATWRFTLRTIGAAWSWIQEAWPTVKAGIASVWGFTLNLLGGAWAWVQKAWPIITAGVAKAWDFTLNLLGAAWSWIQGHWDGMTAGVSAAWDFTLNALGTAWEWVNKHWDGIVAGAKSAWGFTLNLLGDAWTWVKGAWSIISSGVAKAWDFTLNLLGGAWTWLQGNWDNIKSGVKTAWDFTLNALGTAWDWVEKSWSLITSGISSAWGFTLNVMGESWTWVMKQWPTIAAGLSSAWGFTLNLLGESWDWVKKAWSTAAAGIKSAWGFTLNVLGDSWTWIQKEWPTITKGFGTAWGFTLNLLGDSWTWLKGAWKDITAGIKSAFDFTLNGIDAFKNGKGFEFIKDAWNNLATWDGWHNIGTWIAGAATATWNWLEDSWNTLANNPMWGHMWDWITNAVKVSASTTFDWLKDEWNALSSWDGWSKLGGWITSGLSAVKDSFTSGKLIDVLSGVINSVSGQLGNVGKFLTDATGAVQKQIVSQFKQTGTAIQDALADGGKTQGNPKLAQAFTNLAKAMWGLLKTSFLSFAKFDLLILELITLGLLTLGKTIAGATVNIAQAIWDGISAGWQTIVSGQGSLGQLMLQLLNVAIDDIKSIGSAIGETIWEGIKDAFRGLKDSFAQLFSNILPDNVLGTSLRKLFHLPPKQEFEVGGYTGDGAPNKPAGIVHKGEYVIPQWLVKQLGPIIAMIEKIRKHGYEDGGSVGGTLGGVSSTLSGLSFEGLIGQLTKMFQQVFALLMQAAPDSLKSKIKQLQDFWNGLFADVKKGEDDVNKGKKAITDPFGVLRDSMGRLPRQAVEKQASWFKQKIEQLRAWFDHNFTMKDMVGPVQDALKTLGDSFKDSGNAILNFAGSFLSSMKLIVNQGGKLAVDWKATLQSMAADGFNKLASAFGDLFNAVNEDVSQAVAAVKVQLAQLTAYGKSNLADFNAMVKNFTNYDQIKQSIVDLTRKQAELKKAQDVQKATDKAVGAAGGSVIGAILGFLIGGPVGALVGAGIGAGGGYAVGNAAAQKEDQNKRAQKIKDIQQQINSMNEKLKDTLENIAEFLGTSANNVVSALSDAFSANTYKDFVQSFGDSIENMTRSALLKGFLSSATMKPLLDGLAQTITLSVLDGVLDANEKATIAGKVQQINTLAGAFFNSLKDFTLFGGSKSKPTQPETTNAGSVMTRLTGPASNMFKDLLSPLRALVDLPNIGQAIMEHLVNIDQTLVGLANTIGDLLAHPMAITAEAGGTVYDFRGSQFNLPNVKNVDDFLYDLEVTARSKVRGKGK